MRVLVGRASSTTGGPALRPVIELAAAASQVWPVLPAGLGGYRAVLARLCPAWGEAAPAEPPTMVLADALLRLCTGTPEGVLVVVEDLHWADPETLQVVEFWADHVPGTGVRLMLTCRRQPPPGQDLMLALQRRGQAEVLALARLNGDEAVAFTRACLGGGSLGPGISELIEPASGLPLLLEDLLADAVGSGLLRRCDDRWTCEAARLQPPPGFVASVQARVAALGDPGSRAVEAAAVLGIPFAAAWLPRLTDTEPGPVSAALDSAVAGQLLEYDAGSGRYSFRHALTREAVLLGLPAARRRSYEERCAALGGRWGVPADALAEHLAGAGRADDGAVLLLRASRSERATGTRGSSLRMLARAHELATRPRLARATALAYATALAEMGRAAEARRVAADVLPLLDPTDAADLRLGLATAALAAEEVGQARREVDLAQATTRLSEQQWARVWAVRAGIALQSADAGRVVEAEHLAHRAVAAARAAGRPDVTCDALLVLGRCTRLRDLAGAEQAFARARDEASAAGQRLARVHALAELGTVQMMREVRADTLQMAHEASEAIGDLVAAAGITVNLAAVRIMRGELAEAVSIARKGMEAARRYGLGEALPALLVFEGIARGFQGSVSDMEARLSEAEALAPDSPDVLAAAWAIGRATHAQLEDDRERALHCLARADSILRAKPALMVDPAAGPLLLTRSLESLPTDRAIIAAERRSGLGSAWTVMWVEAARAVRAGATGGSPIPHQRLAREAAERYPVFGLVAQRLTAEAAVRHGWGEPAPWLRDLELAAIDRGYPRLAAACRSLARQAGVIVPRRRAVDVGLPAALRVLGVTAREADVLGLMPQRLTNAQMAQRLYISPRTVEKHVASLLLKTGARDRAALARVAEDPAGAPAYPQVRHPPG